MAGKGMVFILALFVVIQTIHGLVNLNLLQCPSLLSLRIGATKNECSKKADCSSRLICCENSEKINICVEGVLSSTVNLDKIPVVNNLNEKAPASTEPSNNQSSDNVNNLNGKATGSSKSAIKELIENSDKEADVSIESTKATAKISDQQNKSAKEY